MGKAMHKIWQVQNTFYYLTTISRKTLLIDIEIFDREAEKIGNYCIEANKMYTNLVQNSMAPLQVLCKFRWPPLQVLCKIRWPPHPYCPPPPLD